MADHKGKVAVAKASQAQPSAEYSSAVGSRLGELIQQVLEHALEQNLGPALDELGSEFERRIQAVQAKALAEAQDKIDSLLVSFRERLTEVIAAEEDRIRKDVTGPAIDRFGEAVEHRSTQTLDEATARIKKELEDASALVHQSFMRHVVTELDTKRATFVEETMKPLGEAADQNLKKMRKELSRMVKEVGQRFVSGTDTEE